MIGSFASIRRHVRELPTTAAIGALAALEAADGNVSNSTEADSDLLMPT
ncbi:Uncharacterised protein [Mycobacteroides abscessus subsp. abscessus]|uniref:Uncharacterized protein n=1 Tax=Mycobacteroides abscessus 21 TaxID=1299324 RepID=A0A829Q0R7_9MYCO|nr:hypothetical protein I543_2147 [Mycobacteroides abscessus 21]SIN43473.1 Uncharacterised protein [Mycobacteroides abscessus subsp. abscessus]